MCVLFSLKFLLSAWIFFFRFDKLFCELHALKLAEKRVYFHSVRRIFWSFASMPKGLIGAQRSTTVPKTLK